MVHKVTEETGAENFIELGVKDMSMPDFVNSLAEHSQMAVSDCYKCQKLLIFGECLVKFFSGDSILFLCTLLDLCPVVPVLDTLKHV